MITDFQGIFNNIFVFVYVLLEKQAEGAQNKKLQVAVFRPIPGLKVIKW